MMYLSTYVNKPFKPPRKYDPNETPRSKGRSPAALLKRSPSYRIERNVVPISPTKRPRTDVATTSASQNVPQSQSQSQSQLQCTGRILYAALFRKPSNKVHKVWTDDGYAICKGTSNKSRKLLFYNDEGKFVGSASNVDITRDDLFDTVFPVHALEAQLDYKLEDPSEIDSAMTVLHLKSSGSKPSPIKFVNHTKAPRRDPSKSPSPQNPKLATRTVTKFKPNIPKYITTQSPLDGTQHIKTEFETTETIPKKSIYHPVFDATQIDNPIIMNKDKDADVDVVVDPLLSKHLRPHQREGVKFMYDCVMSLDRASDKTLMECKDETSRSFVLQRTPDITGCLLADEMGLGKTLMTITLIWTLLKQTPYCSNGRVPLSQHGVPLEGLMNKVLIVCPVTLIGNWKKEFNKWLNLQRIGVLTLKSSSSREMDKTWVRNFLRVRRTYQVLIIGYEKLLSICDELKQRDQNCNKIDLLVCDEGHRLKNNSSKILHVLKDLDIKNRIVLSGTPIQNDLTEFYTIVDFINPGIFGSFGSFKRRYINPIMMARDVANKYNETILEMGEERSKEMIEITQRFTLRRANSILDKYLPPKTDIILFCRPTDVQLETFKKVLQEANLNFDKITFQSSLGLITLLKKICNSPSFVNNTPYQHTKFVHKDDRVIQIRQLDSGKLNVLMELLRNIRKYTEGEKAVIVSNYTQTLDIIENLLGSLNIHFCRLDGSTPTKERDSIVFSFNNDPFVSVFLLSAKSGGVGLNLIGASRLILFDNDWNPSVDLQAMSRIHRDGQQRHCYIYRLITTGCIDEKILQRQLMKGSLSSKFLSVSNELGALADEKKSKDANEDDLFDKTDLRDLFTIRTDTKSNTHDLICSCEGLNEEHKLDDETEEDTLHSKHPRLDSWTNALEVHKFLGECQQDAKEEKSKLMKKCLVGYRHIDPKKVDEFYDPVVLHSIAKLDNTVSFLFVKPS